MNDSGEALLTMQGVWKSYGNDVILQHVDLTIRSGRIIGVVGDNGAGKTTLIKLMAGLLLPDKGRVANEQAELSYILSEQHFYPWMRVRETLAFFRDYFKDFDPDKARRLLAASGIREERPVKSLSQGQKERLCLILGLSRRCSLYLMDESFGGIDPLFKRDTKRFLLENMEENSSAIIATQLLKDMEALFDEVLFVSGKTVTQMETEQIRADYGMSVEEYYMEELAHEQTSH